MKECVWVSVLLLTAVCVGVALAPRWVGAPPCGVARKTGIEGALRAS